MFPCFEFFSKDQKYILSRHIFVNDIAPIAKQIREIEFIIVHLLDLQYLFGWSGPKLQAQAIARFFNRIDILCRYWVSLRP